MSSYKTNILNSCACYQPGLQPQDMVTVLSKKDPFKIFYCNISSKRIETLNLGWINMPPKSKGSYILVSMDDYLLNNGGLELQRTLCVIQFSSFSTPTCCNHDCLIGIHSCQNKFGGKSRPALLLGCIFLKPTLQHFPISTLSYRDS